MYARTPSGLVGTHKRFGGTASLHLQCGSATADSDLTIHRHAQSHVLQIDIRHCCAQSQGPLDPISFSPPKRIISFPGPVSSPACRKHANFCFRFGVAWFVSVTPSKCLTELQILHFHFPSHPSHFIFRRVYIARISCVTSVRPSVCMEQLVSYRTDLREN
jgi:hypothetical protein